MNKVVKNARPSKAIHFTSNKFPIMAILDVTAFGNTANEKLDCPLIVIQQGYFFL